jgi:acyl carrier protein
MLELDTIPRNLSGKVDLRLLKEKADLITLSANASISKTTHHLLVETIIDRPISLDSCPMNDLDSLALLKLIASINNKFSLKMSVSEISTLASWHQFLQLIDINLISLPSKSPLVNKIVRQRREYL